METEQLKIGDPLEEDTRIGATISEKQLKKVVGRYSSRYYDSLS